MGRKHTEPMPETGIHKPECDHCGSKKGSASNIIHALETKQLDFTKIFMPCRVCELLDKDANDKGVVWCDLCKSYICENDIDNWPRRGLAFGKNIIQKISW